MLLATLDVRRTTRDADMLARGLSSDEENLRTVVNGIAAIPIDDGVSFDATTISVQTIRESADYEGVRLTLPVDLGGAALKLRLDLSFGDPVTPQHIDYPTLLNDQHFRLLGYPLESVIAEKADTMMLLGDANTRDRDYGDVYRLSEIHPVEADPLRQALRSVAEHRHHEIRLLGPLLDTLHETRQQTWETFRARAGLAGLPERFSDVVDGVVAFIDGVHDGNASHWDPAERRWN
jgi:hypothetical protein